MKTLVLAEKPSVAREIARVMGARDKHKSYLEGPKYIVTWALGHLVGLAEPEDYDKSTPPGILRICQFCRSGRN